jgi:hypothetical protein
MAEIPTWQFKNFHVYKKMKPVFVNYETMLICSAPANNEDFAKPSAEVVPIGLVENFGVGFGLQLQRIFEIGSALNYIVPGNAMGSGSISTVIYGGPTLLSLLYSSYKMRFNSTDIILANDVPSSDYDLTEGNQKLDKPPGFPIPFTEKTDKYGFFGFDLSSNLFNRPFGLMVIFHDINNSPLGAILFENCYVSGSQFGVSAGAVVLMETVTFTFEKTTPYNLTTGEKVSVPGA